MNSVTSDEDVSSIKTAKCSKKVVGPDKKDVNKAEQLDLQNRDDEDKSSKSAVKENVTRCQSPGNSKPKCKPGSKNHEKESKRSKKHKSHIGTEKDKGDVQNRLQIGKVKSQSKQSSHVDISNEGHTTRRRSLSGSLSPRRSGETSNTGKHESKSPQPRQAKQADQCDKSKSLEKIPTVITRTAPNHGSEYRQRKRRRYNSNDQNFNGGVAVQSDEMYVQNNTRDCDELEVFGFCIRGETCPFDHGEASTVIDSGGPYQGDVGHPRTVYISSAPRFALQTAGLQNFIRMQTNDPHYPHYQPPMNPFSLPPLCNPGVPYGPYLNGPFNYPNMHGPPMSHMFPAPLMNPMQQDQMVQCGMPPATVSGHIQSSYDSNLCSIALKNIPAHMNVIPQIYDHFSQFGKITLIQVLRDNDPSGALLSFSNGTEAANALDSVKTTSVAGIEAYWFTDECIMEPKSVTKEKKSVASNSRVNMKNGQRRQGPSDRLVYSKRKPLPEWTIRLIRRCHNRVLAGSVFLKGEDDDEAETEAIMRVKEFVQPLEDEGKSQEQIAKAVEGLQDRYLRLILCLRDGIKFTQEQEALLDTFSKPTTPLLKLSEVSGYNPSPRKGVKRAHNGRYEQFVRLDEYSINFTDSDDEDKFGEESNAIKVLVKDKEKVKENNKAKEKNKGKDKKNTPILPKVVSVANNEKDVAAGLTFSIDVIGDPVMKDDGTFEEQAGKEKPIPEVKTGNGAVSEDVAFFENVEIKEENVEVSEDMLVSENVVDFDNVVVKTEKESVSDDDEVVVDVSIPESVYPQTRRNYHSTYNPYYNNSYNYGYYARGYYSRGYRRPFRARGGYRGWGRGKNPYKVDHRFNGQ